VKWITRERPKIDRLSCPWLIPRFIDEQAEIQYVSAGHVVALAESECAVPLDMPGVELTQSGPLCSFDAFLEKHHLEEPVLARLAEIVRTAHTDTLDRSAQATGLLAIFLGLAANIGNDQELLETALPTYDARFTWCRTLNGERHGWHPQTIRKEMGQ
jgi:hypothetical protein